MGFLGVCFEVGKEVKLLAMSKTHQNYARNLNLVRKYTHLCSFRKYTFQYQGPLNFANVSIFFSKNQHFFSLFHIYENHCECCKKLISRSWPVLFTLTYLFLIHEFCSSAGKQKVVVIAVFLNKLDHRPLFNDI